MTDSAPSILTLAVFLALILTALASALWGWPVDLTQMAWPQDGGP